MKLVTDTNILISALLKDSTTRALLQDTRLECYAPPHAFEELHSKHPLLARKTALSEEALEKLLDQITEEVTEIPEARIKEHLKAAHEAMDETDPQDAPILAAALSENCRLWSDDTHFQQQTAVEVWTTSELLQALGTR